MVQAPNKLNTVFRSLEQSSERHMGQQCLAMKIVEAEFSQLRAPSPGQRYMNMKDLEELQGWLKGVVMNRKGHHSNLLL